MNDDVVLLEPEPERVKVVRLDVPFNDVFTLVFKVWAANVLLAWLLALLGVVLGGGGVVLLTVLGIAATAP